MAFPAIQWEGFGADGVSRDKYVLAVSGSRHFENYELFKIYMREKILNKYGRPKLIIAGDCRGADSLTRRWAEENGIPFTQYVAEWDKYGRSAGPIRNGQLVEDCDILFAILSRESRGTLDALKKAEKFPAKPVVKVNIP